MCPGVQPGAIIGISWYFYANESQPNSVTEII
jgi:hypothetical protein